MASRLDTPDSQLYARPALRRTFEVVAAIGVGAAVYWKASPYSNEVILGIVLIRVIPTLARLFFPDPEKSFNEKLRLWQEQSDGTLTNTLAAFYEHLKREIVEAEEKIRITVFVANDDAMTLHQVARYGWNKSTKLTSTVVRMGTGVVGRVYTHPTRDEWGHVVEGSFTDALREVGITEDEAQRGHAPDRRSFWATKIFRRDVRVPIGVLAVDSASATPRIDARLRTNTSAYAVWKSELERAVAGHLEAMLDSSATRELAATEAKAAAA